jgi:hypothetical protein
MPVRCVADTDCREELREWEEENESEECDLPG